VAFYGATKPLVRFRTALYAVCGIVCSLLCGVNAPCCAGILMPISSLNLKRCLATPALCCHLRWRGYAAGAPAAAYCCAYGRCWISACADCRLTRVSRRAAGQTASHRAELNDVCLYLSIAPGIAYQSGSPLYRRCILLYIAAALCLLSVAARDLLLYCVCGIIHSTVAATLFGS